MTQNESIKFLKSILNLKEENIENYTLSQLLQAALSHTASAEYTFKIFGSMQELANMNALQTCSFSDTNLKKLLVFIAKKYQEQKSDALSNDFYSCSSVSDIIAFLSGEK